METIKTSKQKSDGPKVIKPVDIKRIEFIKICKELRRKYAIPSNYEGVKAIIVNWISILILTHLCFIVYNNAPLYFSIPTIVLLQVGIASRYRGFENLRHDASHFTLFATRIWNQSKISYCFYAYPIMSTPPCFFRSHKIHHRHLGDMKIDPDMNQNKEWGISNLDQKSAANVFFLLWIKPYTGYFTYYWIKNTLITFFIKDKTENRLYRYIYFIVLVTFITIFNMWGVVLVGYIIPFVIITPVLRFYAEASEHLNIFGFKTFWGNSRNNIGFFHRYILHPYGDGYHQVHHALATIPFFNLKKAFLDLQQKFDLSDELVISDGFLQTINQIK